MSASVVKCGRCRKRQRSQAGWNGEYIAGLLVGHLCPDCQTPEEDLEAELNLITSPPQRQVRLGGQTTKETVVERLVLALVRSYPSPEIMRDKASQLATARKDPAAAQQVWLMRNVADGMESGDLWEDRVPSN